MTENNYINQPNDKTSPKDEEDIIELTDVVSDTESIELPDYTDKTSSISEEEILEFDDDILDNEIKLEDDLNKDIEIDDYLDNNFVDSVDSVDLDLGLDISKDLFLKPQEETDEIGQLIADVIEDSQQEATQEKETVFDTPEPILLSPEQVDEALERVIKKMYADKIDSILNEVIKKTVTKEIEGLKALLLEDTGIDKE